MYQDPRFNWYAFAALETGLEDDGGDADAIRRTRVRHITHSPTYSPLTTLAHALYPFLEGAVWHEARRLGTGDQVQLGRKL